MDDQVLRDISMLLALLEREPLLNGPRAEVAAISARYADAIKDRNERFLIVRGYVRKGNQWFKESTVSTS